MIDSSCLIISSPAQQSTRQAALMRSSNPLDPLDAYSADSGRPGRTGDPAKQPRPKISMCFTRCYGVAYRVNQVVFGVVLKLSVLAT